MALVTLPRRLIDPWLPNIAWGQITVSGLLIDGDTDEVAFVVECPKTGTLTQLSFLDATITTGENTLPVRLETIDASGNPSGTLIDSPTNAATGTVDIANGDDNVSKLVSINSGTGVSVTLGQIIAVRMKRNASGTLAGAVFKRTVDSLQAGLVIPNTQDYNITSGGAWTKLPGCPYLSFNIGGWIAPIGCLGGLETHYTSEAYQSPVERGILLNYPVSARAVGVVAHCLLGAASTVKFILYSDPAGAPAVAATTNVIDTDLAATATLRLVRVTFTAPFTLAANTNYVLAMSPQGAVNCNLAYFPGNATYKAAYPTGPTGTWWGRADSGAGAFSETNTRIPIIGLILDAIDANRPEFRGSNL